MTIKKLRNIAILACTAFCCSIPASGQDLLARQAPVDRKLKAVDSVALKNLIILEEKENPAEALYEDWNNQYAHRATELPDSFRIDLRGFCMPTDNKVVTSNFGARWGRQHKGIDVKVYIGDTIRAAFDGKIRIVRYEARGYGKYVVIRHHNGLETIYGHMSAWLVNENDEVKAGDPIGLGGNTGRSTGSHLHFETRLCGVALNPALMFDFRNQDVVDDYYMFHRSSYQRESLAANKVRGVQGKQYGNTEDVELATAAPEAKYAKDVHFHKVKRGETLAAIARKRGTTVDEICKLNRIGKNIRLMPGQILKYN
ncbi:MAG: M23 family metallopeptidase [Prevotella sp.]|nr:M23 family metallopeptidase [Prevotella sp.]